MQRKALEFKEYYESRQFLRDCIDTREEWGAIYSPQQTLFRAWATLADRVSVCLYRFGTDQEAEAGCIKEVSMTAGKKPGTFATYECVISELHVKDFSYHKASGVSKKNRGKYLAFTEDSRAREHFKLWLLTIITGRRKTAVFQTALPAGMRWQVNGKCAGN